MKTPKVNNELVDELTELAQVMGYSGMPNPRKPKILQNKSREPRPIETKYGIVMYIIE